MKTKPLLLGITGAFGSGKTTASSYFAARGFEKITLSTFLEQELQKNNQELITRKALQDLGNEWRNKFGSGILAQKALDYIADGQKDCIVIDGIRNVAEIEVLRKNPSFLLLAIVANRDVRLQRLHASPRREMLTKEVFEKLEKRDLGVGESETGLQVGMCIALADIFIENNDSEAVLTARLEELIKKYA